MPLKELSHEEQSHLFIQGRICKRQPAKVTLKDRGRKLTRQNKVASKEHTENAKYDIHINC